METKAGNMIKDVRMGLDGVFEHSNRIVNMTCPLSVRSLISCNHYIPIYSEGVSNLTPSEYIIGGKIVLIL